MSGYQRLIAYVYEYTENRKGENKGFIRVEARNGRCRMQFRLKGRKGKDSIPCQIFGYVRREGECFGAFLGNCNMAGETVDFQLDMPENHMGDSSYALKDLSGILIWGDGEIRYGTQWDEQGIDMSEFRFLDRKGVQEKPEGSLAPEGTPKSEKVSDKEEEIQDQQADPELKMEEVKAMEGETDVWTDEEEFQPFADGAIRFCRKVSPSQLALKNNFLIHGYENYHHLLVGKMEGSGQYILGIPGVYDPQERFMAGVFGFPNFKAARREGEVEAVQESRQEQNTFGYWYRLVDASDLNL